MNLLDTPGHRDFSEDTYRTLVAADSAVMLIDAAKGVEAQTRKLFEVCRLRRIPIFTFVNKMDRLGREPLELLTEIEEVLGIDAVPLVWPIGAAGEFRGVYDRLARRALLFSGGHHGTLRVDETRLDGAPRVVAEVRYAFSPDRRECEFALSVADAWHGKGIGALLVADVERRAACLGARRLVGEVLRSNEPMKALARKAGFALADIPRDARLVRIVKDLAPSRRARIPGSVPLPIAA